MYSLATLKVEQAAVPAIGVDGCFWALADVAPQLLQPHPLRGLMNLFEDWAHAEPVLEEIVEGLTTGSMHAPQLATPAAGDAFLAPLQYPGKLVMVGANYYEHIHGDAGRTAFRKEDNDPVFFLKPPTTSLVGAGRSVRYPRQSTQLDYEIELALVIGKRARRLTPHNALSHVAGYTIAIDLSARDWQRNPRHMVGFDLFCGKAFDDSCPIGPGIVPARYVDPADLPLKLWLNGELRQDGRTRDMVWPVPELLALLTEHLTLEPGDIVSTGTPAGVGLRTQSFMKPGDRIDAEIGPLGRLRVEIGDPD
jgi:2-keto-4-pentenoate hydratase/2-oxohepta-3-ene-1,7-dioic acid hydratase in catechol pathway